MGFRFRKSFKIAPGVRFNVGTKSAGLSVGTKGLRYSINSRSGSRVTTGIPGTGLAYSSSLTSGRRYKNSAYQSRNQLLKQQREIEKANELQKAKYEVQLFENKIELIKSIHKECDDLINWEELKYCTAPFNVEEMGPKEMEAQKNIDNFKPNILHKLFKLVEKKRASLSEKLVLARKLDSEDYILWQSTVSTANKVLNGDTEEYLRVIEELAPLDDLSDFGSEFEFFVGDDPKLLVVQFEIHSDRIVPKEIKSLTSTGKLSVKAMSKTQYYDLVQDYVCSCIIRIARDMFAILPIDFIVIHAQDEQLNTSNGMVEVVTILSSKIHQETLSLLNFDMIDCSDAMVNFETRMVFKKTQGFMPVEKIDL